MEPGIAAQYIFKSEDGYKTNVISAKIPVSVLYSLPVATGFSLEPLVGFYGRINIWGENSGHGHSVDLFKSEDSGGMGYKRFQFGFHLGVRGRISEKFMVGFAYTQDLSEISLGSHWHDTLRVETDERCVCHVSYPKKGNLTFSRKKTLDFGGLSEN